MASYQFRDFYAKNQNLGQKAKIWNFLGLSFAKKTTIFKGSDPIQQFYLNKLILLNVAY